MALPPPRGFGFTRRWWLPLTLACLAALAVFLKTGWFALGLVAVIGLLWIVAAKFTQPPHDF
jgi:hypothetical protein